MIQKLKQKTKKVIQEHKVLYSQHKSHLAIHTFLALVTGLLLHLALPPVHTEAGASEPTMVPVIVQHNVAPEKMQPSAHSTLLDVVRQVETGIDVTAHELHPNVSLKVEPDSIDGVNVFIGTENFSFAPRFAGKENTSPNEGHAIVYINDTYYTKSYTSSLHIPSHEYDTVENPVVLVMLVSNDHTPLMIQDQIIYDVQRLEE